MAQNLSDLDAAWVNAATCWSFKGQQNKKEMANKQVSTVERERKSVEQISVFRFIKLFQWCKKERFKNGIWVHSYFF